MLEQILKTILMGVLLVTMIVGALALLAIFIRVLIGVLCVGVNAGRRESENDEKE